MEKGAIPCVCRGGNWRKKLEEEISRGSNTGTCQIRLRRFLREIGESCSHVQRNKNQNTELQNGKLDIRKQT